MDPRRLRPADWLCLVASVALLVLLSLDWFSAGAGSSGSRVFIGFGSVSGYGSLGWLCVAFLVVSALGGIVLALLTVARTTPAFPVAVQVLLTPFAALSTLVLVVVLLFQPSLGVSAPNAAVSFEWPAYAGLLATLLIFVGAWRSMADERTSSRFSRVTPPPARPAPPATA